MHFKTVALIGRHQDSGLDAPLRTMIATLVQAGCRILVESETARHTCVTEFGQADYEEIGSCADLAVVMGGDGTMLAAGRMLAPYRVPLIGINHGRLGFVTDIPLHTAHDALSRVIKGNYSVEERMLLEGRVVRGGQTLFSSLAWNDVVINRAGRGGMIDLRVELDGSFMYGQRADGLIVATPTGSTAYALSANGPVVHPQLAAMLLVPVAPQTLSHRPIIIPDSGLLSITIAALGRVESGASVHFDMQTWSDAQPGDRVDVRRASNTIRLIHPSGYSFFSTLRQKLQWNRMPQQSEDSDVE